VDGEERVLANGTLAAMGEGNEVLFVPSEDPQRLRAVPLEGGAARDVARLPGKIDAIAFGGGAIHVSVMTADGGQAWRIAAPGGPVEREAGSACLVVPAPRGDARVELDCHAGGWQTIRNAGTPIERALFGAWDSDGLSFVYWLDGARRRYLDGRDQLLFPLGRAVLLGVSPDGRTLYYFTPISHVRRQLITNWNDRPRPWRR
jgi:hypothetical protein